MNITQPIVKENSFACVDCHVDTSEINEYYMVKSSVWEKTKLGHNEGMLCIGCLENRIGRPLVILDFTDAPVNYLFKQSDRLRKRMNTMIGYGDDQ